MLNEWFITHYISFAGWMVNGITHKRLDGFSQRVGLGPEQSLLGFAADVDKVKDPNNCFLTFCNKER